MRYCPFKTAVHDYLNAHLRCFRRCTRIVTGIHKILRRCHAPRKAERSASIS
ncbi:Hypothetical protein RAK1035_0083 [Roseovarius sp. AK1035]|nr:Hypothetical protein RAK1035_0083 [Roseovarius sp. AK1035]